jgi:hypothetical protein
MENKMIEELKELWENFVLNAEKFESKGNKAAGKRARKVSVNLAEKFKEWRKHSIQTNKVEVSEV